MYFSIALIYLLFCIPLTLRIGLGFNDTENSLSAEISFFGIGLAYYAKPKINLYPPHAGVNVRYAGKGKKERKRRRRLTERTIRRAISSFLMAGNRQDVYLDIRIGLMDAAESAVAAGVLKTATAAAFAMMPGIRVRRANIQPDFSCARFLVCFSSIIAASPGDIILAMLRRVLNKRQKEGLRDGKASD